MTPKRILTHILFILAIIVGAFMIYGVIMYPTKQPYRDAKAAYQTVYNDNVAFTQKGMSINATKATETAFKASITATRAALETLKADTKKLGDQAVLKDGEGREKYRAFSEKLTVYAVYNMDILTSIEALRPILLNCNVAMTGTIGNEKVTAALYACADTLQKLVDDKAIPDSDYRTMATSFTGIYGRLASATTDSEREALIGELNAANTTLSKNLSTNRAKVDITATAKALDDYLSAKARLFF